MTQINFSTLSLVQMAKMDETVQMAKMVHLVKTVRMA
jgi:hypothetical protein